MLWLNWKCYKFLKNKTNRNEKKNYSVIGLGFYGQPCYLRPDQCVRKDRCQNCFQKKNIIHVNEYTRLLNARGEPRSKANFYLNTQEHKSCVIKIIHMLAFMHFFLV